MSADTNREERISRNTQSAFSSHGALHQSVSRSTLFSCCPRARRCTTPFCEESLPIRLGLSASHLCDRRGLVTDAPAAGRSHATSAEQYNLRAQTRWQETLTFAHALARDVRITRFELRPPSKSHSRGSNSFMLLHTHVFTYLRGGPDFSVSKRSPRLGRPL